MIETHTEYMLIRAPVDAPKKAEGIDTVDDL